MCVCLLQSAPGGTLSTAAVAGKPSTTSRTPTVQKSMWLGQVTSECGRAPPPTQLMFCGWQGVFLTYRLASRRWNGAQLRARPRSGPGATSTLTCASCCGRMAARHICRWLQCRRPPCRPWLLRSLWRCCQVEGATSAGLQAHTQALVSAAGWMGSRPACSNKREATD